MAEALVDSVDPGDAQILLIDDFPRSGELVEALRVTGALGRFSRIERYPGFATPGGILSYTIRAVSTAKRLRLRWSRWKPTHFAFCNDYPYTAQVLLQCARRSKAKTLLLEDGAEAYSGATFAKKNAAERLALTALFRVRWRQFSTLGQACSEAAFYGTFPRFRRTELGTRQAFKLSPEPLLRLDPSKILAAFFADGTLHRTPHLVLMPHDELLSAVERETIQCALLEELGDRMLLKAHPRQTSWDGWPRLTVAGVSKVSPHIPSEILLLTRQITRLVAGKCTALHAARWLNLPIQINYWPALQGKRDTRYEGFLRHLGIPEI